MARFGASQTRKKLDVLEIRPPDFKNIQEVFHLDLDVAADKNNHKLPDYFSLDARNCLKTDWYGRCWCFPPMTKQSNTPIIARAVDQTVINKNAEFTVLFTATRTDTNVWRDWIFPYASYIYFISRRPLFFDDEGRITRESTVAMSIVIFESNPTTDILKFGTLKPNFTEFRTIS